MPFARKPGNEPRKGHAKLVGCLLVWAEDEVPKNECMPRFLDGVEKQ